MLDVVRLKKSHLEAFFVFLLVIALAMPLQAEDKTANSGFSLLSLDGFNVKWGSSGFGTPAVIRYAFIKKSLVRKHGRNCRLMRPFPARLKQGGVAYSRVVSEFRAAFRAWEAVAAVRFLETDDPDGADLLLGVQGRPRGIAYADVIHQVPLQTSSVAPIQAAAVCLNPDVAWEIGFDGDRRTFDVRYVAMHEIGHVIGLDHSWGTPPRVMMFRYDEVMRELQPQDIAGARKLYGPSRGFVGGTDRTLEAARSSPELKVQEKALLPK